MNVRNRRLSEQEMAEYVKDDPDYRPYSGAGSSLGGEIGRKENTPTSARGRAEHHSRAAFVADLDRPLKEVAAALQTKIDETDSEFHRKLSEMFLDEKGEGWESLFSPKVFEGFDRADTDERYWDHEIAPHVKAFAAGEPMRKYSTDKDIQAQVCGILYTVCKRQHIKVTASSLARLLGFAEHCRWVLPKPPAPEPQQLADDGNELAIVEGKKVIYKGKKYSMRMLDALPAEKFAEVLNLRESPSAKFEREQAEEDAQRQRKHDYVNKVVVVSGGTGYTEKMLDELPSEQYRVVMGLRRSDSGPNIVRLQQALSNN